MKSIISFLVTLFFALTTFAQTTLSKSFVFEGITRTYRIYIPAIYDDSLAVPLVLNLHGYGSNNLEQEYYGNFRPIADTANFIVVHPNGTYDGSNNRYWNTFGTSTVNDVGFLSALIDTISNNYSIDSKRVYSTGMSNGGFMSYDLACKLSNKITAIASVAGTMIPSRKNTCNPNRPVPVMQIHGTSDATVPYNGSSTFVNIDTLVDFFVQRNNCNTTPNYDSIPNIVINDNCWTQHFVYSGGDLGSTVEFYKIIGGGHSWPGAFINTNITNMDFSASKEIWRFFRQFTLDQFVVTNLPTENTLKSSNLIVYPNPASNQLTVSSEQLAKGEKVEVYNAIGSKMLDLILNPSPKEKDFTEVEIDISSLAKGIYVVKVGAESLKLVVE